NINGGQGADFISYTVNAPVNVEGGDGSDTLTVVGTEFGDDFVVTHGGVYGAGLFVQYGGIEKVVVYALEGNDHFFIASTSEYVETVLIGGLGSDTFNTGGGTDGEAISVVSNDLLGHSGIIELLVDSSDDFSDFEGVFAQDVSVNVMDADEAGIAVSMTKGALRVFEDVGVVAGGLVMAQYTVVLTRPPEEDVRVTASATLPTETERDAGGKGVELNGNEQGVTLLFDDSNWYIPQTVTVTAPDDGLAEGLKTYEIKHSVTQGRSSDDGDEYDGLAVTSLTVEVVDNDAPGVLVAQSGNDTVVFEKSSIAQAQDHYTVVLNRAPEADVTVSVSDPLGENQVEIVDEHGDPLLSLVFTTANWDIGQEVYIRAADDGVAEGTHFARITHSVSSDDNGYNDIGVSYVDVKIIDGTPGVYVAQTGGSTDVIEPTEDVTIGVGQISGTAGVGDISIVADFGASEINEVDGNDSINVPQDLELGAWGQNFNDEIGNTTENTSQTIPHITVQATGDDTVDYFSFEVTQEMLDESSDSVTVILDIDHGFEYDSSTGSFDSVWWIPTLELINPEGQTIEDGFISDPAWGKEGSSTWYDGYLEMELTEAGTYLIKVTDMLGWILGTGAEIPVGADYSLHVSVDAHDVDAFTYAARPQYENETGNNTAQSIEVLEYWYTYYNTDIGDLENPAAGIIDYSTAYTSVIGDGDGTWDNYSFEVTEAMLRPNAGTVSGTASSSQYYIEAGVRLNGTVAGGDVWTITLNGQNYTYTVQDTDTTLADVINGLADEINDKSDDSTTDYYSVTAALNSTDSTLMNIFDPSGFIFNGLTQTVHAAGSVTQTLATGGVHFTTADITFDSAGPVVPGDVWTVVVDSHPVSYTVQDGDTLETIIHGSDGTGGLVGAINVAYPAYNPVGAVTGPGIDTLRLTKVTGFTLSFQQSGVSPEATAAITGTALPTEAASASWQAVTLALSGTAHHNQSWTLSFNGGEAQAAYTVAYGDTLENIAAGLEDDAPAGYTITASGSSVTVSRTSGSSFTVDLEIAAPPNDATQTISGDVSHWSTAVVDLTGPVHEGETWALTLTRADGATTTYSYDDTLADYDYDTDGDIDIDDVGAWFENEIGASASYDNIAKTLTITDADGVNVALSITAASVQGTMALNSSSPALESVEINLSGTSVNAKDENWILTLDGVLYTCVTTAQRDTLDEVGQWFASNAAISSAGFTVTYHGANDILSVSKAGGFVSYDFTAGGTGTATFANEVESTDGDYEQAVFNLGGLAQVDEVWTLTLDGSDYDYVVQANDDVDAVGQQFDTAGTTAVASNLSAAGFKVVYDNTAQTLTVTKTNAAFTASASVAGPDP
ncbi:MAG: hypothetical protein M0P04_11340, partial [Syntrophales bacterium]|nr:hypothetical protein [Syntrophales bacterium]